MTVGFIVAIRSSVPMEQCNIRRRYWEILYFLILLKFVAIFRFWLKLDKNNRHFTWRHMHINSKVSPCFFFTIQTKSFLCDVRDEVEETVDDFKSHHLRDTVYARLYIVKCWEAPCRYLHAHCLNENNYEFKIKRLWKNKCAGNFATAAHFPTFFFYLKVCFHLTFIGPCIILIGE